MAEGEGNPFRHLNIYHFSSQFDGLRARKKVKRLIDELWRRMWKAHDDRINNWETAQQYGRQDLAEKVKPLVEQLEHELGTYTDTLNKTVAHIHPPTWSLDTVRKIRQLLQDGGD